MYYLRLNHKLVREAYLLPRISYIIQNIEGFQYATALDINMGYYIINISTHNKEMTTIVTEFARFRYNRLPMGMYDSGDIFQAKVDELIIHNKGIKTYIGGV